MAKGRGLNTLKLEQYAENIRVNPPSVALSPIDSTMQIELGSLRPAPWNARRFFDHRSLEMLGDDLKRQGQIHPIVVRSRGKNFEVVVGERRFRAAQLAGLTTLRAHIRELDDQAARRIGLSENLEREDLNPYEETVGWLDLLALELSVVPGFSAFQKPDEDDQIAAARVLRRFHNESFRLNHNVMVQSDDPLNHNVMVQDQRLVAGTQLEQVIVSTFQTSVRMTWQSFVKNRLPILNLPSELLEVLYRGELEYTKAKELARVKDHKVRSELLEKVLTLNLPLTQIRELVLNSSSKPTPTPSTELSKLVSSTVKTLNKEYQKLDKQKQFKLKHLLTELQALLSQ